MKYKERYSIGEVSRHCNISKKALRYYDKIGLVSSQRAFENNYRYYSNESLLALPVIKYYKQMGFTLDEMREFIEGNVYKVIKRTFESKIKELEVTQEEIQRKYLSVKDWYDLILEAEMVIDNQIGEVAVKFVESGEYLFQDQRFKNRIKESIINIEFTNYVEQVANEITGPVMIRFSSVEDRMEEREQEVKILQRTLKPCKEEDSTSFGGCLVASCYHIGAHENIRDTYEKIRQWARHHEYVLARESVERYVTDYWTTRNARQFVTEVMIPVSRK
ncbi:MAG: MerR family transcriptional regulator [Desulfobacterales bacterium]|nr:MerR family transcriptional regulator [Desulfobacterales bacterium]